MPGETMTNDELIRSYVDQHIRINLLDEEQVKTLPQELYVPFSNFLINALQPFGYPRGLDLFPHLAKVLNSIQNVGTVEVRSSTSASLLQGLSPHAHNRNILSEIISNQFKFRENSDFLTETPLTKRAFQELLFASDLDLILDLSIPEFIALQQNLGTTIKEAFQPLSFLSKIQSSIYRELLGRSGFFRENEHGFSLRTAHLLKSLDSSNVILAPASSKPLVIDYEVGTWENGIPFISLTFSTLDTLTSSADSTKLPIFKLGIQASTTDKQSNNTRLAPWVLNWDREGKTELHSIKQISQLTKKVMKLVHRFAKLVKKESRYPEQNSHEGGVFPQADLSDTFLFSQRHLDKDSVLHVPEHALSVLTQPLDIPPAIASRPPLEIFEQYLRAIRKSIYFGDNVLYSAEGREHLDQGCYRTYISKRGLALSNNTVDAISGNKYLNPQTIHNLLKKNDSQDTALNLYKETLTSLLYPYSFIRHGVETGIFNYYPPLHEVSVEEWYRVIHYLDQFVQNRTKNAKISVHIPGVDNTYSDDNETQEDVFNYLLYAGTHSHEVPINGDFITRELGALRLFRSMPHPYLFFVEALRSANCRSPKLRKLLAENTSPFAVIEKIFFLGVNTEK